MHLAPVVRSSHHVRMRALGLLVLCVSLVAGLDFDRLNRPAAGRVLDPATRLTPEAVQRCQAAWATSAHRLIVVVVPDCGGRTPREAGLRLFNRWGLGSASRNDGVLLLVAVAERRAEFLLGDGIDDDANVLRSQVIIDRDMLPLFRRGDFAGAVASGAEAGARELFSGGAAPATSVAEVDVESRVVPVDTQPPLPVQDSSMVPPAGSFRTEFAADEASGLGWLLGGGLGALVCGFGTLAWLRRRPRTCPSCQVQMVRLDETADDAHLTSSQQAEETVGSVDYLVWACPTCPRVTIARIGAWFTRYHACAACGARTASDRTTVEQQATELSKGLERIDTRCDHCGHREVRHRTVPRRQPQRSSGCGSGSSLGSSGFRSMGGSSGGGGRSSGRGGGGGW